MDTYVRLLLYCMVVILLIGGFGSIVRSRHPLITNRTSYIFASVGSLLGILASILSFMKTDSLLLIDWQMAAHISFRFTIDGLSAFFSCSFL